MIDLARMGEPVAPTTCSGSRPTARRRTGRQRLGDAARIVLPGLRRADRAEDAGAAGLPAAPSASHDIVIGIGPAGTGKTYLAVAKAVEALARKRVKRIILARPAVEAGESLGFLPGDLQAKVDPYLRPLYDALEDMMPPERVQRALETRTIEIAPLAYMRGRTLADAFIILDEAQNATGAQMKMFLTRLGREQQGRGHRRQDPDRPAAPRGLRADPDRAHPARASTASRSCYLERERRGPPPPGARDHPRVRGRPDRLRPAAGRGACGRRALAGAAGRHGATAVRAVLRGGAPRADVSVTFVGRDRMRRLNGDYKGTTAPTDVLGFGLPSPDGRLAGDVYVCVRSRRATRARHGVPLRAGAGATRRSRHPARAGLRSSRG